MNPMKMIDTIKESGLYELSNPTYIGILPNDGGIIEGFPQAILTYDEESFNIYTFSGYFRLKFDKKVYKYKFSDILEIEMGKYNFKENYIKIVFDDEKFIAFNYYKKVRKLENQRGRIELFIKLLEQYSESEDKQRKIEEKHRPFIEDL